MARFGQQFLQQMTSPTFGKGLFNLAQQVGAAPGQQAQMEKLKSLGPVEQAQYMSSIARTPQQLMEAQQLEESAVQKAALRSLQGLEAARQAAETDAEKLRIEGIMSRVAVQAGVDPASISGRTQKESDAAVQREMAQGRLDEQNRQTRERALVNAYYRMEGDDLKAFEQNLIDSNFGYIIDDIKEDKRQEELVNLQLKNARTRSIEDDAMKKEPLPSVDGLTRRINDANFDPELKDNFLSRLSDIKQPDFAAGETWNPGEYNAALNAITALNNSVTSEVGREVARKSAIKSDIRRLEKELTKGPSYQEIQAEMAQAEKDLSPSWYSNPSEEEIRAKAYDLAKVARQNRIQDLLDERRFELGEQPAPKPEEPEEKEEEEEVTEAQRKADEIVGL